jgi:cation transport ATPase
LTGVARPCARTGRGTLEVIDDRVFGPGGDALARRFARRVLAFNDVRSLALDPARATATLNYRTEPRDSGSFLTRLAVAVAGADEGLQETELPRWVEGEPVILYRHPGVVSIFGQLSMANGLLRTRHPAIAHNPAVGCRVESALRVIPGVIRVAANTFRSELRIRFDPRAVAALWLIRLAEAEVLGQFDPPAARSPEPVDFRLANVSLGLAATGELALAAVTPVTAGLLVLSNIETFGAAADQLRRHEIGLPVLYSSIVGVTLASGQFLSAALMLWFFRYWEQRHRQDLAAESQALLDVSKGLPEETRVLTADGVERLVPSREISIGQRVRARAGETIPVDAIVRSGTAVVDETALCGTALPHTVVAGDQVLAGSRLLAGELSLEVLRTERDTGAARIAQALIVQTMPRPRDWALNRGAEDFAARAVAPTLLAAGAGLLVGDLTTAGAVLRPDYATGVGLAMPIETLLDVRLATRSGAVLRADNALERLAAASWIVLDDHESLRHEGCDIAEMQTKRLDEAWLLPAVAAAGVWLGDERGPALVRACRARGLIVRRGLLREIGDDTVGIGFGDHLVRLRGRAVSPGAVPQPLIVEVDGVDVAGLRFARNGRLDAAEVVRRLQRGGLRVLLVSEQPVDAAAFLARRLGAERYCGGMCSEAKITLLRDLRRQPVAAAYVGNCQANPPVAREAHLSISIAGAETPAKFGLAFEPSDIALLAPSIASLPAICALARDSVRRKGRARFAVMAPNLLCVAGAFAFGFTPIAAVLVSNFGTSVAYNGAKRALRRTATTRPDALWDAAWCVDDRRAAAQRFVPNTEPKESGMDA